MAKLEAEKVTQRIKKLALEFLASTPAGLRYSELHAKILATDKTFKPNTINGCIWNLDTVYPDKVYKPSKGLFRSTQFKSEDGEATAPVLLPQSKAVKEEDFYASFADWLKNDLEDVTRAITLGGNKFGGKWGTPDVLGKREPNHSDIVKGSIEIVSAEIKTDSGQLITAFGQACAYRLFSHRVYLVVPRQSSKEDIDRIDSLSVLFGLGLVTFDATKPTDPGFQIRARAATHDPDLFYTNKALKLVEKQLFS